MKVYYIEISNLECKFNEWKNLIREWSSKETIKKIMYCYLIIIIIIIKCGENDH